MIELKLPLVSVQWLHDNLTHPDIVILDASMHKVTATSEDKIQDQVPNARFFDIKHVFSNTSDPFPNAVPSQSQFIEEARNLGIHKNSAIVVYDDKGIYSCVRAYYLFKAFGHDNVAVLDGGLPEWKANGFATEAKNKKELAYQTGNFSGNYNSDYFKFFKDMELVSNSDAHLILDARASNRFQGLVDEPREGLRAGNIPNSKNLPFGDLLNGNCMKSIEELKAEFRKFNIEEKELVLSCGSGITACILALGAEMIGHQKISVYDGSWTEYGTLT